MLKSMTAYGQHKNSNHHIEIQSLNRKFLDIQLSTPQELNFLDPEIRKWINAKCQRGQISIKIQSENNENIQIKPNIPLLKQLKTACNTIQNELNINLDSSIFSSHPDILITEENNNLDQSLLKQSFEQALTEFDKMKITEGKFLANDILLRIKNLQNSIDHIEKNSTNATETQYQKLKKRVEGLNNELQDNEERILREICLFSEKIDISEEITRFKSHLSQMQDLISDEQQTSGKQLDFLTQELQRETNTIASKAADINISRTIVEMKTEIEKIREQLQNVE